MDSVARYYIRDGRNIMITPNSGASEVRNTYRLGFLNGLGGEKITSSSVRQRRTERTYIKS